VLSLDATRLALLWTSTLPVTVTPLRKRQEESAGTITFSYVPAGSLSIQVISSALANGIEGIITASSNTTDKALNTPVFISNIVLAVNHLERNYIIKLFLLYENNRD